MLEPYSSKNINLHAEALCKIQFDKKYIEFLRNFPRLYSLEDCYAYEKISKFVILCYYYNETFVGMTFIDFLMYGQAECGGFVLPEFLGQKYSSKMALEIEEYLKSRNIRKVRMHIINSNKILKDFSIKFGFIEKCILEKNTMISGEYVDECYLEKFI